MDKVMAIIPAAGQGKRMGNQVNKQFLCLAGLPILLHTLRTIEQHPAINGIILVCRDEEREFCRTEIVEKYHLQKVCAIIAGGKERQDSVWNGLQELPEEVNLVLIHDGARPFLTAEIIDSTLAAAKEVGAAIAAVPVKDTIKVADSEGLVSSTPNRNTLWQIQTPQVFRTKLLKAAYQNANQAGFLGTDDASLIEYMGQPVKLVLGSYENLKITTPEDLVMGEAIFQGRAAKDIK